MITRRIRLQSAALYAACAILLLVFLYIDFFGFSLSRFAKIAVTAAVFVFAYFGSFVRCRAYGGDKARAVMYDTFFFLFTVYIVIIVDFTLIDVAFGREMTALFTKTEQERRYYLQNAVNYIPFATVRLFFNGYKNGLFSFGDLIVNLAGNLLVFAPAAFFVPVYIKRINRAYRFVLFILAVVLIVEALQALFMTGAADIDDVILNVSGAAAFYGIFATKPVSRVLCAVTFGVWRGDKK